MLPIGPTAPLRTQNLQCSRLVPHPLPMRWVIPSSLYTNLNGLTLRLPRPQGAWDLLPSRRSSAFP
eukprot:7012004-Karenia_brevis.AAC.1